MQAQNVDRTKQFLDQAKSFAGLDEVYRSAQVTLLLNNALPFEPRLEAKIFEAAYGDRSGRKYWETQLSEPVLVYKFARLLAVHIAESCEQLDLAIFAIIMAFRDAAEASEDWFIGDIRPLLALEDGERNFVSLRGIKVRPRAAAQWLLTKPKRQHLVPGSLRSFLQFDGTSGKQRPLTEKTAERFVDDYINNEQGRGRRPTIEGVQAAAKEAQLRGGREHLRATFNQRMGGKRGRPAKAPAKTAEK
jgi:hypothetical protein